MWIERQLTGELRRLAESFPVLVLVGPRQIGKTALLERAFDDYAYVPLDLAGHAEMAETRPDDFLRRFPPPVVLDEIQYAPSFFRHVKTTVDSRRGENGLFVMSGSQNFLLSNGTVAFMRSSASSPRSRVAETCADSIG